MNKIKNFILLDLTLFIIIFIFLGSFVAYVTFLSSNLDETSQNKQKAIEISEIYMKTILNISSYEELIEYNIDDDFYYFDTENMNFYCFYNEKWELVNINKDNPTTKPAEAKFELIINIETIDTTQTDTVTYISNDGYVETTAQTHRLVDINLYIYEQKKNFKKEILYLNTKYYFIN